MLGIKVTGLAENVEAARREIENQIFASTGGSSFCQNWNEIFIRIAAITGAETSLTNYLNQQVIR